jgi:hypothetical protein
MSTHQAGYDAPQERAHFGKAIPPNFGDIDLKDFLP